MSKKTYTSNRIAAKEAVDIETCDVSHSSSDDSLSSTSSTDIHCLFAKFNKQFFWGKLTDVKLEWSNIMTRCAGKCYSRPRQKYYCIRLSRPLLSRRPHSDLVETLLHEMIHAYLAVTRDRELAGHGANFHEHMRRINKAAGTNISVYHNFHAEVKSLKQHWWRCDGPCQKRSPFFGWVKRATNRSPGPWESWWRSHSYRCGGRFVKVKEPVDYTMKRIQGLFGYGVSSTSAKLVLNSFGFELMHCGEPFGQQIKKECIPTQEFASKAQNITRSNLTECPLCMKRMSKGVLPEHLQVCSDIQRLFEDDRNDSVKNDCGRRKSEVDISSCPLCDKTLFKGYVKEHLDNCDRLLEIFDNDNFGKADVTCPFCDKNVEGDLSSHISVCLNRAILSFSDESDYEGIKKGEEVFEKCIVCDETLRNISLTVHLESCKCLQGVFDDNVFTMLDHNDFGDCVDTKSVQYCPLCDSKVDDLAKHFTSCLSSYKELYCNEPDSTLIAADVKTVATNHSSGVNTNGFALTACPICGLEVRNDLNCHLERDCLSNPNVLEEFDLPFLPRNNKDTVRNSSAVHKVISNNSVSNKPRYYNFLAGNEWSRNSACPFSISVDNKVTNNYAKSELTNSDYSRNKIAETDRNVGVNGLCLEEHTNVNVTNKTVVHVGDTERLIFCRGCGKFYSASCCPVCCRKL